MLRSAIRVGLICAGTLGAVGVPSQGIAQEWHVSSEPWFSLGSLGDQGGADFGSVVGAIRIGADAIAVADGLNYQVRLFGLDGRLRWTLGRFGEGPGEFQLITAIGRCPGGSIVVYDQSLARLTTITPEGTVEHTRDVLELLNVSVPPREMTCSTGAVVFLERPSFMAPPEGVGPRLERSAVAAVNSSGDVVNLGDFPSERYFYGQSDGPRLFGKTTLIAAGKERVYVGTGEAFEVSVFSMDGASLDAVRDTVPRLPITDADIAAHAQRQIQARPPSEREAARRLYASIEYPGAFPAYDRILVDSQDYVWIRRFVRPADHLAEWRVYDAGGQRKAVVQLPQGLEILEVGADYVLGSTSDEFDVQSVHLFSLTR